MDNSILHDSTFGVDPNGHGGNHRTAQIAELVGAAGFKISDRKKVETTIWSRYVNGIYFLVKHKFNIYPSFGLVGLCGHYYQIHLNTFTNYSGKKLFLWEAIKDPVAPYAARDAKFKIINNCQF